MANLVLRASRSAGVERLQYISRLLHFYVRFELQFDWDALLSQLLAFWKEELQRWLLGVQSSTSNPQDWDFNSFLKLSFRTIAQLLAIVRNNAGACPDFNRVGGINFNVVLIAFQKPCPWLVPIAFFFAALPFATSDAPGILQGLDAVIPAALGLPSSRQWLKLSSRAEASISVAALRLLSFVADANLSLSQLIMDKAALSSDPVVLAAGCECRLQTVGISGPDLLAPLGGMDSWSSAVRELIICMLGRVACDPNCTVYFDDQTDRLQFRCPHQSLQTRTGDVFWALDILVALAGDAQTSISIRLQSLSSVEVLMLHFSSMECDSPALLGLIDLLKDSSDAVRHRLTRVLRRCQRNSSKLQRAIASYLKIAFSDSSDEHTQASLIDVVASLCSCPAGDIDDAFRLFLLLCLVERLGSRHLGLSALAFSRIRSVAASNGCPVAELFARYQSDVAVFMIDRLDRPRLIEEFALLLGVEPHVYLEQTVEFTLPHLILQRNSATLETLTVRLGCTLPALLIDHVHHIFAFLFVQSDGASLENAIHFLRKLLPAQGDSSGSLLSSGSTNSEQLLSISDLLRSCATGLVNKLVLELGEPHEEPKHEQVIRALRLVAIKVAARDSQSPEVQLDQTEIVSVFLKNHFLGVLYHINGILQDERVALVTKQKAFRALIELVQLVGPCVYSLSSQIMATLQAVSEEPECFALAVSAWSAFVRTLEIGTVGPILSQIVVALLRMCARREPPAEVVGILEYLIVEQRKHLAKFFDELVFIPDHPAFAQINLVITATRDDSGDIRRHVQALMRGLGHENVSVVEQALLRLSLVLRAEWTVCKQSSIR